MGYSTEILFVGLEELLSDCTSRGVLISFCYSGKIL